MRPPIVSELQFFVLDRVVRIPYPVNRRCYSELLLHIIMNERRKRMASHEEEKAGFFVGFLMGGVIGALAGLLLAPKSGRELREVILQKGEETLDEAKGYYQEAREKSKSILDEARQRADDLRNEANRQLVEARLKAREVLRGAEVKAADAIEGAKSEVRKVKVAVEAGVNAAKQEFSREDDPKKA